jgi:acyl-homoserine lactone synthase
MGWNGTALGPAQRINGALLGAFCIHVDADTPARLAATGIYAPVPIAALPVAQAA